VLEALGAGPGFDPPAAHPPHLKWRQRVGYRKSKNKECTEWRKARFPIHFVSVSFKVTDLCYALMVVIGTHV
jgi:hypothetical protein